MKVDMFIRGIIHIFGSSPADQEGERRYAHVSTRQSRKFNGLWPSDQRLARNEAPSLGAHVVTPHLGFAHHGIYVGDGNVVHFGALAYQVFRRPVEEVSLARFAQGRCVYVRFHGKPRFETAEVIRRARARIGENAYRLLSNNCEHFCEWCLHDRHRSYQVDRAHEWLRLLRTRLLHSRHTKMSGASVRRDLNVFPWW